MAQDRADLTPTPSVTLDQTTPGGSLKDSGENTAKIDLPSMASIDKLLALTEDDDWDIDDQVRTIQSAAGEKHPSVRMAAAAPSRPPLRLPTPYELSPMFTTAGGPGAPGGLGAGRQKPSIPPPLPSALPQSAKSGARPSKGPPPLPPRASEAHRVAAPPVRPYDPLSSAALIELLTARVATLEGGDDKVGLARVQMELAIVHELLGEEVKSAALAETALKTDPEISTAHSLLRRRKHGRGSLAVMLTHLDHEIAAATEEAGRVELLVEKARLLEAVGDRSDAVRAMWETALTHAPEHAAALKGLEAELVARVNAKPSPEAYEALAVHLAHVADAYGSEPHLAAWIHVERAEILEKRLGRIDAARGAHDRALELDSGVGPVREAFVRHVSTRQDASALVIALDQEAKIEESPARSARLELDAASVASERLGDPGRAIALLERAAARAPTVPSVDRRVLDDLVRLRELRGEWGQASRARRARLRFVTDPPLVAEELRALATIAERLGDSDAAMNDVQRALAIDGKDPTLVETLDGLLASADKDEQRVALWLSEAARTEEGPKRARALTRAAHIAEHELGRPADAIRHLRGAWVASPGDAEVLDALSRLLTPAPSETVDGDARALVDLYAQAAEHAHDPGRKIAYLEKIALVWEDLIGDPRRAAKAYEDILKLEPDRRGAILGLGRAAGRTGEERVLARALLDEARLSEDGVDVLSLKARAATVLSKVDPPRALALVNDVLSQEPAHATARALEMRLHEESRRWDAVATSIKKRLEHAKKSEKAGLYIALAEIQDARLHAPADALAALRAAHALEPNHPVPPAAIARMLESTGDFVTLRMALEELATDSTTPDERARHLIRAAEIEELRLGDDARAAALYAQALAETPDDELVADRLVRVLFRRASAPSDKPPLQRDSVPPRASAPAAELVQLLAKRIERAGPGATAPLTLLLGLVLADAGQDLNRAISLLESLLLEQPHHVPALRTLEAIYRKTGAWAPLARALTRQADAFSDIRSRLGALWQVAALEEWRLPVTSAGHAYAQILELDPTDPGALDATVRRQLPNVRRGDPEARASVVQAMRQLCALAADDTTRLSLLLRVGILLEQVANEGPDLGLAAAKEALDRYRQALAIDPSSVTATTGLARLSNRLNDTAGSIAAAIALADLTVEKTVRARYLLDAAELLLGEDDAVGLGTPLERANRAADLLERALDAEPDNIQAAARLAGVRLDRRQGERLVDTFRAAIQKAKSPESIIYLGTEIAHVARDEMRDLTIAIHAMRRVRESAPDHVPSLLTLAELCIAQRAWPEAVDALEAVVATSRDNSPRLTALFALASIYEKVLARPEDAERVLRAALDVDPKNARALRALLRRLTSGSSSSVSNVGARAPDTAEVAMLLQRLAEVETDPEQKCGILMELAELRLGQSDTTGAEQALMEAVAQSPSNAKAFAKLASLSRTPTGQDAVRYARVLLTLVTRGQQLGKVDARWLSTLGQLEISSLNRSRDGIGHLQRAVQMDPSLYETRFELASAYARAGANDEAGRALLGMILPEARPLLSISDPGAALSLLERTLSAEHRAEDALVVSELRAVAGELDDGRHAWLRARRLGSLEPHHGQLDRATLVTQVLPAEGRHVLLEVAAAVSGIESKMLRADLTELGLSPRDRVGARSGQPTRSLLDRVARTLGVSEVELVIASSVSRTRVLSHDVPWVVVPRGLTEMPEPRQVVALARAVARIALGVPWLEELPPPHVEALLIAAARQAVAKYAVDEVDVFQTKIVAQYEPAVARILSRRQKKLLEELAPHVAAPQGKPLAIDAFINALARAEIRTAYLVAGDLLATIDETRGLDAVLFQATDRPGPRALHAVLEHGFAGDVCRFALTPEATLLRRRVGSTWTR